MEVTVSDVLANPFSNNLQFISEITYYVFLLNYSNVISNVSDQSVEWFLQSKPRNWEDKLQFNRVDIKKNCGA